VGAASQSVSVDRADRRSACRIIKRNPDLRGRMADCLQWDRAWNEGDVPTILANVQFNDGYRTWNGGCFSDVNWMQRRPYIYGEYTNDQNVGSLTT